MTELALSDGEAQRLDELEMTIERGLQTFVEVGNALLEIRDGRLYRVGHETFEEYTETRWNLSRRRAYQIMDAAASVKDFSHELPTPNESQARELARVPEEQREKVWQETHKRTEGKPTAAAVRETHSPPEPEPSLPEGQDDADEAAAAFDEWVEEREQEQAPSRPAPVMLTLHTHKGDPVEYPQPQGKPTFNETTGEGISWAAWSWNPVTGCLHGCTYCYARAIANHYTNAYPVGFTPLFHEERLDAPSNTTIPAAKADDPAYRRVFVCSMADLYGRWVPDEWIQRVHKSMLAAPNWEYLLLTKFPDRYPGLDLPPNSWIGTSVDEQKRVRIAERAFRKIEGVKVKWLSLEPLLEPLEFTDLSMFDWVVIGAQTQTNQPNGQVPEFNPPWEWVDRIYHLAKDSGCKVHMKPNLKKSLPNEYPFVNESE